MSESGHVLLVSNDDGVRSERIMGSNKGANLGDDIPYSGTVPAAMEGTLLGIPSIAVSLVTRTRFRFDTAAAMAVDVARKVLKRGLPDDTLLNVNVPNAAREGS